MALARVIHGGIRGGLFGAAGGDQQARTDGLVRELAFECGECVGAFFGRAATLGICLSADVAPCFNLTTWGCLMPARRLAPPSVGV